MRGEKTQNGCIAPAKPVSVNCSQETRPTVSVHDKLPREWLPRAGFILLASRIQSRVVEELQ